MLEWGVEDIPGTSRGKALVQRATNNAFNVIVAPGGPYTDVDVSVRFKPISGREDASGGIVFRFAESRYYVIRANALEDNFNLYYYDHSRHQITGARVKAPTLGQWHKLYITAEGDHIKGGWMISFLSIIVTAGLRPAALGFGRRRTRSRHSMIWSSSR